MFGELETSLDIARELLELGQRAIDPELCALAATSLGASCIALGRFEESLAKFATAPEQFELSNHRATAPDFGIDVEVVFHTLYSRALACRGYLEQAANQSSLGLKRARMLKHLPSIAIALGSSCTTLWLLRSSHRLEQYASELLSLSGQLGFGFWLARGKASSGWVSGTKGLTRRVAIALPKHARHYAPLALRCMAQNIASCLHRFSPGRVTTRWLSMCSARDLPSRRVPAKSGLILSCTAAKGEVTAGRPGSSRGRIPGSYQYRAEANRQAARTSRRDESRASVVSPR